MRVIFPARYIFRFKGISNRKQIWRQMFQTEHICTVVAPPILNPYTHLTTYQDEKIIEENHTLI